MTVEELLARYPAGFHVSSRGQINSVKIQVGSDLEVFSKMVRANPPGPVCAYALLLPTDERVELAEREGEEAEEGS